MTTTLIALLIGALAILATYQLNRKKKISLFWAILMALTTIAEVIIASAPNMRQEDRIADMVLALMILGGLRFMAIVFSVYATVGAVASIPPFESKK